MAKKLPDRPAAEGRHESSAGFSRDDGPDLRLDGRLRAAGFSIHSRPREGPPIWARDGELFTQDEAEREL